MTAAGPTACQVSGSSRSQAAGCARRAGRPAGGRRGSRRRRAAARAPAAREAASARARAGWATVKPGADVEPDRLRQRVGDDERRRRRAATASARTARPARAGDRGQQQGAQREVGPQLARRRAAPTCVRSVAEQRSTWIVCVVHGAPLHRRARARGAPSTGRTFGRLAALVHGRSSSCRSRLWTPGWGHYRLDRGTCDDKVDYYAGVFPDWLRQWRWGPAGIGVGRRTQARAQRLPGTDDRASFLALAGPGQLRARAGRYVRGLACGWKLTGGAKVVAGNESFAAHGETTSSRSRSRRQLGDHAPMCVGVLDPTLRYFAANDGGVLSLMTVSGPLYPPTGGVLTAAGLNVGGRAWAPSLPRWSPPTSSGC